LRLGHWLKHFLVYGLGVVLMNLMPALMIPIYTYRVTPAVYGVLELLNRSQEILILILSFGLGSAVATFYQMERGNAAAQKALYSTAVQYVAGFSLAVILVLLPFSSGISRLLFGSKAYGSAVVLILISTYFEVMFQSGILYLQSELRSILYVSTYTARSVLGILLNLVLVFWWRWGLMGILCATLIHTSIFGTGVIIYMFRHTGFCFERKLIRELLTFSAPLMIGGFSMFMLNNGDRYFLEVYRSSSEVGLYGVGYRLGTIALALLMYPFTKIWSVTMVDISRQPDGPTELGRIATYLVAACIFTTLGLSVFGPYLVKLMAERSYWEASRLIPIVGFAYIFYAWSVVMDASFYVTKRTVYKIFDVTLAGAVVTVLYRWLIPHYGMMGAAWATVGGFASFAAFKAFFAQRVFRIHYELGRIAWLFVIGILLYEAGAHLPMSPVTIAIAARACVVSAFPIVLWRAGIITQGERNALGGYWQTFRVRYLGGAEV
jgi:O-antigen/teichoic acid export membrane protein